MEPPVKKRRALWSVNQLAAAMAAVENGLLSERAAAMHHGIPRRTLKNHLNSGIVKKQTEEQENDLASRIIRLASIGVPLTPKSIRLQVCFFFCEKNNIKHCLNERTHQAGKD